ncbi:hypothetical protein OG402_41145 [Streptomyces anulatus]|uniref:hypothetical protein n=1 Tax=Streptomyces anulatus TaxID=1892 RepID=UPI002251EEF1|nr:hypothetical protein [Streptomyces anulatus]MCX4606836.1 hypothetical protein [Streptomyces anulatus]WSI82935.1 hypothetical protein OG557_39230 [Streptomyces anulatus]
MATLARTVFVRDPEKHRDILLRAGETPDPQYAVLVTNPACWEGGKLPAAVKKHLAAKTEGDSGPSGSNPAAASGDASGDIGPADPQSDEATPTEGDTSGDTKPAAKRAARKPARGRTAADEGTGGQ